MNKATLLRSLTWGLLVSALALPVGLAIRGPGSTSQAAATLGDYGGVPEFRLTERSGRGVSRADLRGGPWVASFLFTRCHGVCPAVAGGIARLEKRVGGRARMVSFTVDPEHDTPEALAAYATRFGASPDGWLFLTGHPSALRDLVSGGFRLSYENRPGADPGDAVTHSNRVALVDANLRIRGYYVTTEDGWMDRLLKDLATLERASGGSRVESIS